MSGQNCEKESVSPRDRHNSWTDADIKTLIKLWTGGKSNSEIAKTLGRNENAVAIKASRLRLPPKSTPMEQYGKKNNAAKIRNCLCCSKPFFSEGIGNRICEPCKGLSSYSSGDFAVQFGGRY